WSDATSLYSFLRQLSTFSSFFSSPPRRHRDLHSFPTRRSSDLLHRIRTVDITAPLSNRLLGLAVLRVGTGGNSFTREGTVALDGDRKSTRLNSSHVKISYAVFCLKKKKQ